LTITKWSDKVAAASAANRFVDRNTWSQIEATLLADSDKLVARTRRPRTTQAGSAEGIEDPEVFDDGDFYQQLLKDVVESRTLDLGAQLRGSR
jgi:protein AATF/BFR2